MCTCNETYFFSQKQRIQLNKQLKIDDVVNNAINQLYNDRKIDDKTKQALMQSHYEPLKQAVNEGYNVKVEYGTPNYEFLKALQTNTAVFAAFKNHSSIKEMTALLKDKDGNLRSREDFKKEALNVDANYRGSKLDSEYDTAVRSARMATMWQKFEKNKRLYPNLKYILTKAAKPDEKHLKYVGIIRPVDDSFWNAHYPPNRWRCQCSVEQTDDDATDIPNNLPPVPKDFAFNSGKTQQVFDLKNCSYADTVDKKEMPKLIKEATAMVNNEYAKNAPYNTLYESKSGGSVEVHPLSYLEKDFDVLKRNAYDLANMGKQIQILPAVKDIALREALLPKEIVAQKATPDYYEKKEQILVELKQLKGSSKNTIKRPFSEAKEQAENIIIDIPQSYPFTKNEVIKMVTQKSKMKEAEYIKQIWINYKGEWLFNPHKK